MANRDLDYYDSFLSIRFSENPSDPPDGYNVTLMGNHFYLPSRCLQELTRTDLGTGALLRKLINLNEIIPRLLQISHVSPEQFHIALLKVGLLRAEKERDYFIDKSSR